VVYLGVPAGGGGPAAVKAVRPEYAEDAEFRARFAAEAELARRVRGPYTARVLAADTDGPVPWLATEYVPGPGLDRAVRDGGPFPEDSLRVLAAGLAEALAAIHSVGLVHRDLKPSNVLLSPRGPQVIDFGISRAVDATSFTRTGQTLGTPGYMSPEQATGAALDHRGDVFSYGGVLVFAATGRRPFGTGDPAALLYRVVNEEPDLSGVPDGLRGLAASCLAKDPADRPGLDAVLAGLGAAALPGSDEEAATAWLPDAVATQVIRTAATLVELAPTLARTRARKRGRTGPGRPRTGQRSRRAPGTRGPARRAARRSGGTTPPGRTIGTAAPPPPRSPLRRRPPAPGLRRRRPIRRPPRSR